MELSIIVVNYNSCSLLECCLSSVASQFKDVVYEVCVVDNASTDESIKMVKNRFPYVRLIVNDCNVGFASGINIGLEKTVGRYVLWLNPDTQLLDSGITNLLQFMDKNPKVAILGPQIIDPCGSIQLSCRSFPSYQTAFFNRYSILTRLLPKNRFSRQYLYADWDHKTLKEVDWVSGACLLHRRAVIKEVGPLDEQFFMYCEDVDFCLRVRKKGLAVYYHPEMRVLHHIAGSSQSKPIGMLLERHRSIWRYYGKHFHRTTFRDGIVFIGIIFRFIFCIIWIGLRMIRGHKSQSA